MIRLFLCLLFLFFNLAGCCAQHKPSDVPVPAKEQTSGDKFSWDFGRVKEGAVLKREFILKNESGNALNIKNVTTSCGCTASEVRKNKLSPGESTSVEVRFDSKGYEGAVQQFVYVQTDSIDNPVLRFIIRAEVVK